MRGKLKVIDGNILYLISALIYFTIGLFVHFEDERLSLIAIQFFVVLLPTIIYIKVKGASLKETLRLKKIRVKHCFLVSIITILLYPLAMLGNIIILILLSLFGELQPPQIPTPNNVVEYFILILIVSLVAGICEEVLFRGFMLSAYEKIGKTKAIIITSILFGFFHFNLYNLFGPIVLGLVFGYLVFLTDSIFAGIVGHMVNNGFAMTLSFLINIVTEKFPIDELPAEPDMSITTSLMMSFVFLAIVSIITGFIAYVLFEHIRKDMKKLEEVIIYEDEIKFEENNFVEESSEIYITKFSDFVPLIFIVPLYAFVILFQIKQLLGLI